MSETEKPRPTDLAWANVQNAVLDLRFSELREATALIEKRIVELEAQKL